MARVSRATGRGQSMKHKAQASTVFLEPGSFEHRSAILGAAATDICEGLICFRFVAAQPITVVETGSSQTCEDKI